MIPEMYTVMGTDKSFSHGLVLKLGTKEHRRWEMKSGTWHPIREKPLFIFQELKVSSTF